MVLVEGVPLTWFFVTVLLSKVETKVSSVHTQTMDTVDVVYYGGLKYWQHIGVKSKCKGSRSAAKSVNSHNQL